jgi:hypothetical protein
MTSQEIKVRDTIAEMASVDPDDLVVTITPVGNSMRVAIYGHNLDDQALARISSVMDGTMTPINKQPWWTTFKRYWFFIALACFVFEALVLRSWIALIWLATALLNIPKRCPDCGKYHLV